MVPVNANPPFVGAPLLSDWQPSAPVAQGVVTEPATKPVLPPGNDTSLSSAPYQHTVVLDAATKGLIFRVIDTRSRLVVRQVPDEAMLRMRAYARTLADGKGITAALTAANLEL
jgi:hypothetical protein